MYTNWKTAVTGYFKISKKWNAQPSCCLALVQTCRLLRYKATIFFIQKVLFGPARPGTLHGDVLFHRRRNTKAHQDNVPETARLLMPRDSYSNTETFILATTGGYGFGEGSTSAEDCLERCIGENMETKTMALRCCKDTVVEKRRDNRSSILEDARQLCIQSQKFL